MPYRPQFAFATPPGNEDQDFDHYYDSGNTPGLNIPPGNMPIMSIPLNIDPDADFMWRGIKIPMGGGLKPLFVRFRDPNTGRYLQDDFIPAWNFAVNPASNGLNGGQSCIQEAEIKCPRAGVVMLDLQMNAPQPSSASAPVVIAGVSNGGGLGSYSGVQWGAIQWKGALWQFVTTLVPGAFGAFQSVDGGHSYQEIDAAHDIPVSSASFYWDGKSNQVVCIYQTAGTGTSILMKVFNLDTQVWGATFGAAAAPTYLPLSVWVKANGSDVIGIFQDTSTAEAKIYACLFTGGAWGTPLDLTTSIAALPGFNAGNTTFGGGTAIIDSQDRMHVILSTTSSNLGPPTWNNRYFYVQVNAAVTAISNLFDFPGQQAALQDLAGAGFASAQNKLVIVNNSLVWGVLRQSATAPTQFPAVYVGSNLTSPSWAESGSIDPNTLAGQTNGTAEQFPNMFFDPTTGQLYAVYTRNANGGTRNQVQLSLTRDSGFLTQWTSQTLFDDLVIPPAGTLFYPLIVLNQYGALIGISFDNTENAVEQRYYTAFPGIEIILTGVKRYGEITSAAPLLAVTPSTSPGAPTVVTPISSTPAPAPAASQPCPPIYSNLCWALRNGMVQASQFDPQELEALQLRCSQLGYTGNCPPPPCIQQWIAANISNLPHISVGAADLAGLPQAPQIGYCPDSWAKGGVPANIVNIGGVGNYRGRR